MPGIGEAMIEYAPGESPSSLFGGNSNWRGPIWLPVNYLLIQAIEKFHRFLGDGFTCSVPCLDGKQLTLNEIATLVADRVVDIYRRDGTPIRRRCRRNRPSKPASTGRTCCSSMSIFMPIPARAWEQRIKPAGRA